MDSPTGAQHEIAHGPYRAVVTEVGAALRSLTFDDRPLLLGFGPDQVMPAYRGAVLVPWPNRVADGRYSFGGRTHQLALSEPERGTAIHGLVAWSGFRTVTHELDRVVLAHRLRPSPGYPFGLDVEVEHALADDGLRCSVRAQNVGQQAAPYGCALHPYLVPGQGRVDDWTLTLPATHVLDVDPERLLPRAVVDVEDGPMDARRPLLVGAHEVDHAFTGLVAGDDGSTALELTAPGGTGLRLTWDPRAMPWVQVHTADRPGEQGHREGLVVEPMTCPPDAFSSGTDLVRLEPGQRHEVSWRLQAW